jgi:branched-subunit amino acid transport protein AzlD
MNDISYILLVIAVMALATFATRLLPFIFFHQRHNHPLMDMIAKYTPPMIMSILVLYVLKGVDFQAYTGLSTIVAVFMTAAIHLWKGNPLVSIFTGTFFYMFLVQTV